MGVSDGPVVLYRPRRVVVGLVGLLLVYVATGVYMFVVGEGMPTRILAVLVVGSAVWMMIRPLRTLRGDPVVLVELTAASLRVGDPGRGQTRSFAWMDLTSARLRRLLGRQLSLRFASTRSPLSFQKWWFAGPDWDTLVERVRVAATERGADTNL